MMDEERSITLEKAVAVAEAIQEREQGWLLLNKLADILELPEDCNKIEIHIACDDVARLVVYRIPSAGKNK
jgi:plasmid maintenance system antidote protein VapI